MSIKKPLKTLEGLSALLTEPYDPVMEAVKARKIYVEPVVNEPVRSFDEFWRMAQYEIRDFLCEGDFSGLIDVGCDDPPPVKSGYACGLFELTMSDNMVGIRQIRDDGYKRADSDTGSDVGYKIAAGDDVSDLMKVAIKIANARKIKTVSVYIPDHLNTSWLDMTGSELYPVIKHYGGRLQVSFGLRKIVAKPAREPHSPEKSARIRARYRAMNAPKPNRADRYSGALL